MIQIVLGGKTYLPENLTPDQRKVAIVQCETLMHMLKQGSIITSTEWDQIIDLIYQHFDFVDYAVNGMDGWRRTSYKQVATRWVYLESGKCDKAVVFKVSVDDQAETISVECEGFPGWEMPIAQARNEFLLGR